MEKSEPGIQAIIPKEMMDNWQTIVDIVADLMGIPAALIMRLVDTDIEVFVASRNEDNPFHAGNHENLLGSGLYCEAVINTKEKLLIPNALADEKWKNNPDIKFNLISYLGFPILLPDGRPFGTICILDNKENAYSETYEKLMENFRDMIQSQLEIIYMNTVLGEENKTLSDYLEEIKILRGIVPICSFCKKIRDEEGNWTEVESYVSRHSEAKFSHSLCPKCQKEHYANSRKHT